MRVFETGNIYFTAWAEDGGRIAASTNAPGDLVRPKPREAKPGRILQTRGVNREMIEFVPSGRCLLVGTSLAPTLDQLHKLAVTLVLLGVAIVAVGFAVGWWLATRALRPIAEISTAAQEIAAGDLAKRINASETTRPLRASKRRSPSRNNSLPMRRTNCARPSRSSSLKSRAR